MTDDLGSIRRERKVGNARMYESAAGATFRAVHEVEAQALRDGALPQRTKELVALGIAIAEGCHG